MDKNKALIVYVENSNDYRERLKSAKSRLDSFCKSYFRTRYKYLAYFIIEFLLFSYCGFLFSKINPEASFYLNKLNFSIFLLAFTFLLSISSGKFSTTLFSSLCNASFGFFVGLLQFSDSYFEPNIDKLYYILHNFKFSFFALVLIIFLTECFCFGNETRAFLSTKAKVKRYTIKVILNIFSIFIMLLLFKSF